MCVHSLMLQYKLLLNIYRIFSRYFSKLNNNLKSIFLFFRWATQQHDTNTHTLPIEKLEKSPNSIFQKTPLAPSYRIDNATNGAVTSIKLIYRP